MLLAKRLWLVAFGVDEQGEPIRLIWRKLIRRRIANAGLALAKWAALLAYKSCGVGRLNCPVNQLGVKRKAQANGAALA